jgi:helix-turn-helix protein
MTDFAALAQRASRASHDLVGWIFWDPQAIKNYAALGVPHGVGYYVASRMGPIAEAGDDVVAATAYSINATFLGMALDLCREHTDFESAMRARDDAVVPGLVEIDPSIPGALGALAEPLWAVVDGLHNGGRALFAAHRERPRPGPEESALSAWLAVNCLREWRGDTHWALCVAGDLNGAEVGLLHDVMVEGYEAEWIARSRGSDDAAIEEGWRRLEAKGLVVERTFTDLGRQFRLDLEDRTDEICGQMWEALGETRTVELCEMIEPHHAACLARIDATAGPNWMPAARHS